MPWWLVVVALLAILAAGWAIYARLRDIAAKRELRSILTQLEGAIDRKDRAVIRELIARLEAFIRDHAEVIDEELRNSATAAIDRGRRLLVD